MSMRPFWNRGIALIALIAIGLSVFNLERGRSGLEISPLSIGTTPATFYRKPGSSGPLVVVAHGFAGSRQLMQAYSLSLAQSGYAVLAFDFEGHGRNRVPMSGDVTAIDGTTALLIAETRRVIAAGRALPGVTDGIALLGHSMATDILVRVAIEERRQGTPIDAVVAISMFSEAVSANVPARLLGISGEWERLLRAVALDAVHQVQPDAVEGETVAAPGVLRRAVVAPHVEHVGVLYSATALSEARNWLDDTFERGSDAALVLPGPWILLLMAGIVCLLRPLVSLLPKAAHRPVSISARRFWISILLPAGLVPLVAVTFYVPFLPVLVADYLMIHLVLYGGLQLALLGVWRQGFAGFSLVAICLLALWGCLVFGVAMDRYAASFMPNVERFQIVAILAIATVPFMVADAHVSGGGRGVWWRRIAARVAILVSLGAASVLDPARLTFVFIILPVLVLFYLVHGLMGRWVARQSGCLSAGLGLGLCLAWALGVSFPLFAAGGS